jgi:hypothetical protein
MILWRANRLDEARKLIALVPLRGGFAGSINYIIAQLGDSAAARQRLRERESTTPPPADAESFRALTYLGLGDTASALSALERATKNREIWHVANGLYDPMYESVRESIRFKKLLAQVGLTP